MSTPDGHIVIMQLLAELRSRLARERRDDDADVVVQAMTSISSMELHRQMYENKRAPASCEPSGAEALRSALTQAAQWFDEYAEIHEGKDARAVPGAASKAQRNRERADYCRDALRNAASGSGP